MRLGSAHPTPEAKVCCSHPPIKSRKLQRDTDTRGIFAVFPVVKDGGKPGPAIQGQPLALPVEPLLWDKKTKASIGQNDARLQPAAQTLLGTSSTCSPSPGAMTKALLFIARLYFVLSSLLMGVSTKWYKLKCQNGQKSKGCLILCLLHFLGGQMTHEWFV